MDWHDPKHLCCNKPEDCDPRHMYCFQRYPKHAVFEEVQSNGAGTVKAPVVAPDDVRAPLADAVKKVMEHEEQRRLDAVDRAGRPEEDMTRFKDIRLSDEPMILSGDSQVRKDTPIGTGVIDYFPRALAAVALLSKVGNDKHNPEMALHWDKRKSTDHANCVIRHFIDRGKTDPDSGLLHDVGMAWRALANLELVLELLELKG